MAYRWTLTNLSDNSTEVLSKDPIGWDEGIYKITRSEKYKGAFQEYTTSLKFHCDGGGKQFIDNVYQTEDIDGRIQILCEYDCDGSGTFDTLFDSIINLASYKEDGQFTTVNIERSDLLTKINSRDDIKVDLETTTSIGGEVITSPNTTTLPLTPIEILYENEWVVEDGYSSSDVMSNTFPHDQIAWFTPVAELSIDDFKETLPMTGIIMYDESLNFGINSINNQITPLIKLINIGYNAPITVNWEIDFSGTWDNIQTVVGQTRDVNALQLILYKGFRTDPATTFTVVSTLYSYGSTSTDVTNEPFSAVNSGSFTLNVGEQLYLVWFLDMTFFSGACTVFQNFNYNRSTFKISATTTYNETESKSLLVHEAFNQVVDAIADSDNNFESDFYGRTDSDKITYAQDGCGSLIAITNGLNIREFTGKSIFCSLKDLFDTFNALHNIGLGIVNNKVRVEPLSYWFDNTTEIISLPNVNNYETRNDNTRYFNNIQIGYDSWETEFKGGLDEPCTRHEYSTKIASAKNTYTQLSKYIASSYAIELTRRKNINIIPTEDWQYDNDNFLIALTRTSYGYGDALMPEIYADSFSVGSGMQALDTAYNLRLTPKRMLLAHMNIITAGLQLINGFVKFIRGDGNTSLQVAKDNVGCQEDFNGQILGENDDLIWDESNVANISPLWLPEIYTFEYPLTYTQFKTIKANPYGYISFYKFADDIKKGFLMNLEYNMKTGLTSFTLLKMYE